MPRGVGTKQKPPIQKKKPKVICARSPNNKPDPEKIRDLAMIQCTMTEIAACCHCSVDTLERHYADIIKKGYEEGKQSLRRAQYLKAMEGNPTMLVWCGKHTLKQREVIEVSNHATDVDKLIGFWENAEKVKDPDDECKADLQ